jgi:hypothetical protein
MPFRPSRKILLVVLPALFFHLMTPQANSQEPAHWKVYRHSEVPFEFSYPGDFLLDAHVNAKLGFIFALMKKQNTPWLIDVDFTDRAAYLMDPYSQMSREEFATAIGRLACDADGPEGSVSCPAVARQKVLQNRNGLEVVEFYLNQVNERYNQPRTTKSVIGPIEAVLLPTGRSGHVLTFKRTDRDQSRLVTDELLRRIADSVKLAR